MCFASWVTGIYDGSLSPTFEIGSLAFFRSENHVAFFDHLDGAGDFKYRRIDNVPVHTLSTSLLLPKQSVWNFRTIGTRLLGHGPSQAQVTPDPKSSANANIDSVSWMMFGHDAMEAKTALLAAWEVVVQDLNQQAAKPGLKSGRTTVLDEGNLVARLHYGLLVCIEVTI
ncbi:hypothetical protein ACHAPT_011444 [Fusarium lateritium]